MAGEERSLVAILEDAIQHGKDNPTHGTNCACMDRLIRELKAQVNQVLPTSESEPSWEVRLDSRSRVSYLMRAASRYL